MTTAIRPVGPRPRATNSRWEPLVQEAAAKHGVPADVLRRMLNTESAGRPTARSPKGAMGLMQLMPGTARQLGVRNPWDPRQSVMGGAKYLKQMLNQFKGNIRLAVAAYNAGPGNVRKYGGVPPFAETRNYVRKILG